MQKSMFDSVRCLLLAVVCSAPALTGTALGAPAAELVRQGMAYLHGEGVARDPDRGITYLCAAAWRDHAPAAYELGWLYLNGRGVHADDALAVAWLRRAESLGLALPERILDGVGPVEAVTPRCRDSAGRDRGLNSRARADLARRIYQLAPDYDLDPALVLEVVRAESNFNPRARSHKGALGLMQLIPATARRFGVRDPLEPLDNLRGGMAYLQWLLQHFDGDLALTLAGYNAGENAVKRYGGIPPYAETRDYVERILQRYDA
jgi:hypothetical protein